VGLFLLKPGSVPKKVDGFYPATSITIPR